MELSFFSGWLDDLLEPKSFEDYCPNGLCVEANDKVTKVVTGVSFRDSLIDAAIEAQADCIIVHHPNGFWKGEDRLLVGKFGERMRRLMQNGISLYGFHLPLDAHMEVGNNVQIAKALGLNVIGGFMQEGEKNIGVVGSWDSPASRAEFQDSACNVFVHGVRDAFFFGPEQIKKVAICSGSGASGIQEAMSLGCDAFITGEIKESVPILCEEKGVNLLTFGHHRTEIFGVRALAEKIQSELNLSAKFVDLDNPV